MSVVFGGQNQKSVGSFDLLVQSFQRGRNLETRWAIIIVLHTNKSYKKIQSVSFKKLKSMCFLLKLIGFVKKINGKVGMAVLPDSDPDKNAPVDALGGGPAQEDLKAKMRINKISDL